MNIALIIPAYNEATRIGNMLDTYTSYFQNTTQLLHYIIVLNGCTDNTLEVVQKRKQSMLKIIELPRAGKGYAITIGFEAALDMQVDLIGFVDADMATKPQYFKELIDHIDDYDGIIASRYMKESQLYPPRPAIKEWGRRLVYQPLIWLLFGMRYVDYQCGAKLFKRHVVEQITPYLSTGQWAFDVELLYLCKRFGFSIKEWPTTWYDQADSKLRLQSGFRMLASLFRLRWRYSALGSWFSSRTKD